MSEHFSAAGAAREISINLDVAPVDHRKSPNTSNPGYLSVQHGRKRDGRADSPTPPRADVEGEEI